jgi:hypothetical protein
MTCRCVEPTALGFQGNVTFTVKGKSSSGFEPSTTLAITATSGQNTVEADCYVAVIPPTITINPPGPFQMNYDINHIPQKSAITVEITDPTNVDAPIVGVSVDISVADPTVAGIDAGHVATDGSGEILFNVTAVAAEDTNKLTTITVTVTNDPNASAQVIVSTSPVA